MNLGGVGLPALERSVSGFCSPGESMCVGLTGAVGVFARFRHAPGLIGFEEDRPPPRGDELRPLHTRFTIGCGMLSAAPAMVAPIDAPVMPPN